MTETEFKQQLLRACNIAKQEMNDVLEDETHLPSQYIALGLKQGVQAVMLMVKHDQLNDLSFDMVKRYKQAKKTMLVLHPMKSTEQSTDFGDGFQLASCALIDVITNDEQLTNNTKLSILQRMNEQLTALGKAENS
ncbi:hypothetical protein ACFQGR_04570 [Weissella sagaensis]|uniref:Uncharacterized protein n=1 Tax=Weissella sagaensis TaxID=2559928 RepID=A0ABW1RTD0_9LACO|nr:hypothetical protein [Weissella sagaensis]